MLLLMCLAMFAFYYVITVCSMAKKVNENRQWLTIEGIATLLSLF